MNLTNLFAAGLRVKSLVDSVIQLQSPVYSILEHIVRVRQSIILASNKTEKSAWEDLAVKLLRKYYLMIAVGLYLHETQGAEHVTFMQWLEVTPTVLQKGRIRLKLHISQNVPGQVLQQADGEVLAIDKQEIETQVEVKSGETLALGGIFTRKNKSGQDSVPLLGDIPWFGQLFRHDGKEDERRELVVFITPRLVSSE